MALSIEVAFLIVGGIIAIGYVGELISKRFAIPSALLLLAFFVGVSASSDVGRLTVVNDTEPSTR